MHVCDPFVCACVYACVCTWMGVTRNLFRIPLLEASSIYKAFYDEHPFPDSSSVPVCLDCVDVCICLPSLPSAMMITFSDLF